MGELKNNKGVTLIVLTITIIVLLIITSITILDSRNQLGLKKVNSLRVDIESIDEKVSDYYLKNNSLPVYPNTYCNKQNLNDLLVSNGGEYDLINANDSDLYYVINLSQLDNLTLNYGQEYQNWTEVSTFEQYQDLYIINKETHQIYYPKGIRYKNKVHFSKDIDSENVSKVNDENITDVEFSINTINVSKYINIEQSSKATIRANIKLNIGSELLKNTLQYSWNVNENVSNLEYTKFDVDEYNLATLTSKEISSVSNKYLFLKILDKNGEEHTIVQNCSDLITENTENTFTAGYATIDVVWLNGTTNTPRELQTTVNPPILEQNGESMTAVKWNTETNVIEAVIDPLNNISNWYSYSAAENVGDYSQSKWANARTTNQSYFVWIPRYAYRITYYENQSSLQNPTGYYDGNGCYSVDGLLRKPLPDDIETTEFNGKSYIVHPAFGTNLDRGGWSSQLSGFWVAKFEISEDSDNKLKSTFNVQSKRNQPIGEFYVKAREATYGFTGTVDTKLNDNAYTNGDDKTSYMYSHMMKNSEWGAVAYLTHSQYGRNGTEIGQNTNENYYCGGGQGDTAYIANVSQSSTGNVYGIYDLSGGSFEMVSAYAENGLLEKLIGSNAGGTMISTYAKDETNNYVSTKYITKYINTSSPNVNKGTGLEASMSKIGDALIEVKKGLGNYNITETTSRIFEDADYLINEEYPFFPRGGYVESQNGEAGIFCTSCGSGYSGNIVGFRTVLCP